MVLNALKRNINRDIFSCVPLSAGSLLSLSIEHSILLGWKLPERAAHRPHRTSNDHLPQSPPGVPCRPDPSGVRHERIGKPEIVQSSGGTVQSLHGPVTDTHL